jgi:hypothetical protein
MERDDRTSDPEELMTATGDEPEEETLLDRYDDAILNADDTGMVASERLITQAEIAEADSNAGDV